MAYVKTLFDTNFLEYASYVIKDRAIPHIDDGLKPVQRRLMHSLFEMDDGKFHKVANVVGHCMQYHPHGDQSIYSALVVLANKDLFIEKQGNFGNLLTGDQASAARYIECRVLPLAKEVLYNPDLTEYEDSYDGRKKEPVTFPAKIPIVLIQGAEGIAVGMSTKILPHNFNEVLDAMEACLRGNEFILYPDFPSGGLADVSDYQDGMGKVLVRAKLDTRDPKRIIIRELPFGITTEMLIASVENAARTNKIKIAGISDFTGEEVEIEIKLARGVQAHEILDSLYAFTECETTIAVNLIVIKDKRPELMTVTQVLQHHAKSLVEILRKELELERRNLRDRLHMRTLEQIFIEERIYKEIEEMKTQESVTKAVVDGFVPYHHLIKRKVTDEDVERLLRIPIRRISLYDINKAKREMDEIRARLKEIEFHLNNIVDYAVGFLSDLRKNHGSAYPRRTEILSFDKTDVREAAQRNLELRYDEKTGYIGTEVKTGSMLYKVSPYDRILVIRKTGMYSVTDIPEKLFVDTGMTACLLADKDLLSNTVFTVVYRDKATGYAYIKRCKIEQYILEKGYDLVPENGVLLRLTVRQDVTTVLSYKPKPRLKILEESFPVKDYLVKGVRAVGVRLSAKEIRAAKFVKGEIRSSDTVKPDQAEGESESVSMPAVPKSGNKAKTAPKTQTASRRPSKAVSKAKPKSKTPGEGSPEKPGTAKKPARRSGK